MSVRVPAWPSRGRRSVHRARRSREKFRPHAARSCHFSSLFLPSPPLSLATPLPLSRPLLPRYSSRGATSCVYARPVLRDRVAIFPCDRRGSPSPPRGRDPRLPRRSSSSPLSGKAPSSELSAERRRSSVGGGGGRGGGGGGGGGGGSSTPPPPRGLERATSSGYG